MSDQYTPTTDEVRDHWVNAGFEGDTDSFDRWLAEHDSEVAAKALRDAATEMREILRFRTLGAPSDEWLERRAASIEQAEADLNCPSGEPCTAKHACIECRRGD